MRFRGKYGLSDLGTIGCDITCSKPEIRDSTRFVVDTGATYTVIMDRDALNFGISYDDLEGSSPMGGIGGSMDTYLLKNVELTLEDTEGKLHVEKLKEMRVARHNLDGATPIQVTQIMLLPSLLGLDVLKSYQIRFDRWGVLLEK